MYEAIEDKKAIEMIDKTELGALALNGMEFSIANVNNVRIGCEFGVEEAVRYIRDVYLEDIKKDFFKWICDGNENGRPMILEKWRFKQYFSEIDEMNSDLKGMIDDIAILYQQEWHIFGHSDSGIYLATTEYKNDYNKIDLIGIHKAMSKFTAITDIFNKETVREDVDVDNQWGDVLEEAKEEFIEEINQASNNLFDKYDIYDMDDFELRELVCAKIGLADYV